MTADKSPLLLGNVLESKNGDFESTVFVVCILKSLWGDSTFLSIYIL